MDNIAERHRQEKKDLKAKAQKMRTAVDPSDRKRKKEVNSEIGRLERELKERHEKELQDMTENQLSKQTNNLSIDTDTISLEENDVQQSNGQDGFKYVVRDMSRAQKKKEKKRLGQKQRQEEHDSEDVSHLRENKEKEKKGLQQILQKRGLKIHEIPSDGDCLYRSIEHQMLLQGIQTSVQGLRSLTAEYMRDHKDDFLPFIASDSDDLEKGFEEYCNVIEKTNSWGGHLELQALSHTLDAVIEVLQADAPVITFGNEEKHDKKKRLLLSYHRHAYSLGEHYNSLVKQ